MADTDLDPAVIRRTQETLGKFVKKPPLTEKLLKKPPFRFLHDVFKAVIKNTGFFEGLYTSDELNIESIKDRDDKMRFLQKMIDVVKWTTEKNLNVRASKIVAGHEAENTNELLQLMGEIIESKKDWQKALKAVIGGAEGPMNVTLKKEINKDPKTKEKPKESKASVKVSKEIKPKEGQSKKSTPSPEDKVVKRTIKPTPKEKERMLNRQSTVEKIPKEKDKEKNKDKMGKKLRDSTAATKTKDERTRTSPPSVKPVTMHTSSKAHQENAKIENETLENENKDAAKEQKDNSPKRVTAENSLGEMENTEAKVNIDPKETINISETGALTSLENTTRKASLSGQSRRSSAGTQKVTQGDSTIKSSEQNAVNAVKSINEVSASNLNDFQNPQETQESAQVVTIPKDIKREPTFTHENSRDSVGSNSISSNNRPRTSLRPPTARPPSARPGAPRRRDKNVEIILQPNDQIKLSNINVKLETFGDLDDDGENLVIIEDATNNAIPSNSDENKASALETASLEQKGHLVQQILETQKELVQQNGEIDSKSGKDTTESGFDASTRQSSTRQMNNLREIIQSLTKSVNPFGKLMDFVPEDIDAMQLELNMWRDNYTQAASDLKREKLLTESATEPMKVQLTQIDANIKEYLEMIDASRVKILQNAEKVSKMLLDQ